MQPASTQRYFPDFFVVQPFNNLMDRTDEYNYSITNYTFFKSQADSVTR